MFLTITKFYIYNINTLCNIKIINFIIKINTDESSASLYFIFINNVNHINNILNKNPIIML